MVNFPALLDGPLFDVFGVAATYHPKGGADLAIFVIKTDGDRVWEQHRGGGVVRETLAVLVRSTDVATPMEGDRITIGGEMYRVSTYKRDVLVLTWSLSLE